MDPHTSLGRLCMDEHHGIYFNDKIESEGNWSGPEYLDIADSGKKKEVKAFNFHMMETEEVCERYITLCFVEGLDAYDGIIDLEYEKILISNEFAVKLGLQYEIVGEELIRGYKAIKEKEDPIFFMLPIRLEGKYNNHALVDTGSNINMMPYRIYELLGRDKVKPRSDKVRMLDHLSAEFMGRLLDVLCEVGVTIIIVNFILLDVPMDRDVPIIVGRSFMYTCEAIMNTIKGNTSTFDGFFHQQFKMVKEETGQDYNFTRSGFKNARTVPGDGVAIPSDAVRTYKRRRQNRNRFMGLTVQSTKDPMDCALAEQDDLNPFNKICVWKKAVSFLGALPVPLTNTDWKPNHSGHNSKVDGDGKWHPKIRVMDPYGNVL
ncbi:agenet domain-containing protein [Tanacetum coccineum]